MPAARQRWFLSSARLLLRDMLAFCMFHHVYGARWQMCGARHAYNHTQEAARLLTMLCWSAVRASRRTQLLDKDGDGDVEMDEVKAAFENRGLGDFVRGAVRGLCGAPLPILRTHAAYPVAYT